MDKLSKRIPQSPPIIPPLPEIESGRPLWSIMIPVYNCSQYLPDVLHSILSQDMGADIMQIEIIDDASTDADVKCIVENIGGGRVQYYRQEQNVGSLRNFETCLNRSKGHLIHLLHGDDRVINGFYKNITQLFENFPDAGAAFCNYNFIDEYGNFKKSFQLEETESGILNNWLVRIAELQKIQFVGMVVKRKVYEHLGSFFGMSYGEDWEMWVRIAKNYPVAFTPEILAEYRTHSRSLTSRTALSGIMYHDMCKVINIIQGHLPLQDREKVLLINKKHCAHYLLGTAINIWQITRNYEITKSMIIQSLRLHTDFYGVARIIKLLIKMIIKGNLNKKYKYETQSLDINNKAKGIMV